MFLIEQNNEYCRLNSTRFHCRSPSVMLSGCCIKRVFFLFIMSIQKNIPPGRFYRADSVILNPTLSLLQPLSQVVCEGWKTESEASLWRWCIVGTWRCHPGHAALNWCSTSPTLRSPFLRLDDPSQVFLSLLIYSLHERVCPPSPSVAASASGLRFVWQWSAATPAYTMPVSKSPFFSL